jgi:3-oxoacyl-[acyl-carrier protein] reductase
MARSERKTAIVTGSGTGVGAATVLELSRRGYNVLVNYSKSEREAEQTAARCRSAGADALLVKADIVDDADCKRMAAAALERWGRLDALVNNAGVSTFIGPANWDALDAAAFRRILDVNVLGTFQMVRACVPQLKIDRGAIVNVSSIAGALGIGSSVPYIASKGGVNAMTLYLARTLAPDVRVNAVCPGLITTRWFADGMGQAAYEGIKARYEKVSPLGKACSAEDVAGAIVWLIEGAGMVTGELVLLDSGLHLGQAVRDR